MNISTYIMLTYSGYEQVVRNSIKKNLQSSYNRILIIALLTIEVLLILEKKSHFTTAGRSQNAAKSKEDT